MQRARCGRARMRPPGRTPVGATEHAHSTGSHHGAGNRHRSCRRPGRTAHHDVRAWRVGPGAAGRPAARAHTCRSEGRRELPNHTARKRAGGWGRDGRRTRASPRTCTSQGRGAAEAPLGGAPHATPAGLAYGHSGRAVRGSRFKGSPGEQGAMVGRQRSSFATAVRHEQGLEVPLATQPASTRRQTGPWRQAARRVGWSKALEGMGIGRMGTGTRQHHKGCDTGPCRPEPDEPQGRLWDATSPRTPWWSKPSRRGGTARTEHARRVAPHRRSRAAGRKVSQPAGVDTIGSADGGAFLDKTTEGVRSHQAGRATMDMSPKMRRRHRSSGSSARAV
jgi:hypothetical protein